jgi:hypothetical protein
MSGQAGGRGYLVQALASVLDALTVDHNWTAITLEPDIGFDKVDILWKYPTSLKVVQVKSSQNQIGLTAVKAWAEELERSITADEYELRLIGPVSEGVPGLKQHGRVTVPTPDTLNPDSLMHQAAHKLDRYLQARQLGAQSPSAREMIVDALATRLSTFATRGMAIEREVFDGILRTWLKGIEDSSKLSQQALPPKQKLTLRREEAEILTRLADSRTKMLQFVKVDSEAGFIVLIDADALSDAFDTDASLRYIEAFQQLREHRLLVNHSGDGQVFHLSATGRDGAKQIRGKCLGCGRSMVNVETNPDEPPVWECNHPRCIDSTWHRDATCQVCGKRPTEITGGTLNSTNFLCENGHAFQTRPKRK